MSFRWNTRYSGGTVQPCLAIPAHVSRDTLAEVTERVAEQIDWQLDGEVFWWIEEFTDDEGYRGGFEVVLAGNTVFTETEWRQRITPHLEEFETLMNDSYGCAAFSRITREDSYEKFAPFWRLLTSPS